MSKGQRLRAVVEQRLTAAVEEIFWLFDSTIAEYEEEASRLKGENDRQRKLLDAVLNPGVQFHRAVFPPDVQQLLVSDEEVPPEQQELQWSASLDQEEPEPPHIKEEQEELWTSQEGEQLQEPEEADISEFSFTPVPVKSEDDEDKQRQSSQLYPRQTKENREAEPLASSSTEQMRIEADGRDCGESEPARNLYPANHLQAASDGKTSHSSETDNADSDHYRNETREPQSGLDSLKNNVLLSHRRSSAADKVFSCLYCGKGFHLKGNLQRHMRVHTGEKPFGCSECGKCFRSKDHLKAHTRVHTGEKPFSCSVCGKIFSHSGTLCTHMKIHTGEKPCSCSVCGKIFSKRATLRSHMRMHTEEPCGCSFCGKIFSHRGALSSHMRIHTGNPFSC